MHYRILASLLPIGLIVATASAQPAPQGTFGANPAATFVPGGANHGIDNTQLMNGGYGGVSLSLGAINRCDGPLANNNNGTYYASPGRYAPGTLGCSDQNWATWNFDFFIGGANAGRYQYKLWYDIDPSTGVDMGETYFLPGSIPALGGGYQDSWNLGMPFISAPQSFNPTYMLAINPPPTGSFNYNATGVYTFELDQYAGNNANVVLGAVRMNVVVTPEPATLVLLGTGLLGLGGVVRRRRRSSI